MHRYSSIIIYFLGLLACKFHYSCSDFHAENRSSGTIVDMKLQDPPTNMEGNGNKLDEQMEKLDIDPNSVRSSAIPQSSTPNGNGSPHILGTAFFI